MAQLRRSQMLVALGFQTAVAQIFNLPYRRFAAGGPSEQVSGAEVSTSWGVLMLGRRPVIEGIAEYNSPIRQMQNRFKICATLKGRALPRKCPNSSADWKSAIRQVENRLETRDTAGWKPVGNLRYVKRRAYPPAANCQKRLNSEGIQGITITA